MNKYLFEYTFEYTKDPGNNYQTQILNIMKNRNTIIKSKESYKRKMDNPVASKLIPLIKLHKVGKPIRPLINAKTPPNYKISKLPSQIINHKMKFQYKYNIKNSIEFTEQLKKIRVNKNTKLYSFDISNMYTNIPTVSYTHLH